MASKVFTDFETIIDSAWLNPVSELVYDLFGYPPSGVPAKTAAEGRYCLFACEQSPDDNILYGRKARAWVEMDASSLFPEAPTDGLSYARQHTGTPDEYGNANEWTRALRVYVQDTDPALV